MVEKMSKQKESSADLKQAGWTKQFTVEKSRVNEYVELYESLGFEVFVEELKLDELNEECKICYEKDASNYATLYTRVKKQKREKV